MVGDFTLVCQRAWICDETDDVPVAFAVSTAVGLHPHMVLSFGSKSSDDAAVRGDGRAGGAGEVSCCAVFHNPAAGTAVVVPDNCGLVHSIFGNSQVGGFRAVRAKVQTDTVLLKIVVT